MSTKPARKRNNDNNSVLPALTIEVQNSKKQNNGSESSVTNNSIETEVSSINDSLTGSINKDAFQSIFVGKLGKDTAQTFLVKNTVFPSHAHFLPKNTENSFYSILKGKIDSKSVLADNKTFDDFFMNNLKMWNKRCNLVRTELVNRCKLRYFSKYNDMSENKFHLLLTKIVRTS